MQKQRKTLASEMLRTGALLQSLSNMQQHTPVLRGLQPDLIKDLTTMTLAAWDMLIDGKRLNLSPGMNITAEIKTGQRRFIEFLLSPVPRAGSESLRE